MAGTNLLSTFKECLKPGENTSDALADDDDEEDREVLFRRLPDDTNEIQKCITSAQACMLLLILKEHLKEMYSLTDGKISRYSPSEQKIYEKAVTRKQVPDFNPKSTIEIIKKQQEQKTHCGSEQNSTQLNDVEKMDLVQKYLDFKQLMLKLDPDDDSEEESKKINNTSQITTDTSTPNTSFLNSTGANMSSLNDSMMDVGHSSSTNSAMEIPHFNYNMNSSINQTPTKDATSLPSSRYPRNVGKSSSNLSSSSYGNNMFMVPISNTTAATSAIRKPAARNKRKKRKMVSSDEDSEEEMYDDE